MKIDFQSHVYPKSFLKAAERSRGQMQVRRTDSGLPYLYYKVNEASMHPIHDGFHDMAWRLKDMDKMGVDIQVLSISVPGVDRFGTKSSKKFARIANDGIAELVEKNPDRAVGLATLPMLDVEASVDEVERAVISLGMRGVSLFSNVLGKNLDSPEFYPVYEKIEKLKVPIYIHPNIPIAHEAIGGEYALSLIYGWPFDTSLALGRLMLGGVFDRYPSLKFIFAHGGGMVPTFKMRLESTYSHNLEAMGKAKLKKPLKEYYKQIYLDTALYWAPPLHTALAFAGADHLVFATDYPYGPNDGREWLQMAVESVESMAISEDEKVLIFEKNARKLLKLS